MSFCFVKKKPQQQGAKCLLVDQVLQGQEDLSLLRGDCHQQ